MTETRTITLGGNPLAVPPLPLRLNMIAYPLCRKLGSGGLLERIVSASGTLDCTEEEMADLAALAFTGAKAADPGLTREAFDDWPITPPELLDAFFLLRYQTGGWVATEPKEGQASPGEAKRARKPRKSTSAAS